MGQPDPGAAAPAVPFQADQMISARAVCVITGLSPKRIREAAAAGHLTVMKAPEGVRAFTRYSRKPAEALARAMIQPATANLDPPPTEVAPDA